MNTIKTNCLSYKTIKTQKLPRNSNTCYECNCVMAKILLLVTCSLILSFLQCRKFMYAFIALSHGLSVYCSQHLFLSDFDGLSKQSFASPLVYKPKHNLRLSERKYSMLNSSLSRSTISHRLPSDYID